MDDHARIFELERDMDHNERAYLKALEELGDKVRSLNRIGVSILTSLVVATVLLAIQLATGR